MLGIAPSHVQVLTLGLVEPHDIQSPMLSVCLNGPTKINNIYTITELIPGAKGQVTCHISESSCNFLLKTKNVACLRNRQVSADIILSFKLQAA